MIDGTYCVSLGPWLGVNSIPTISNEGRAGGRAPGGKGGGPRRAGAFGLKYTACDAARNSFAQTRGKEETKNVSKYKEIRECIDIRWYRNCWGLRCAGVRLWTGVGRRGRHGGRRLILGVFLIVPS